VVFEPLPELSSQQAATCKSKVHHDSVWSGLPALPEHFAQVVFEPLPELSSQQAATCKSKVHLGSVWSGLPALPEHSLMSKQIQSILQPKHMLNTMLDLSTRGHHRSKQQTQFLLVACSLGATSCT
jgi:hypothetical protein